MTTGSTTRKVQTGARDAARGLAIFIAVGVAVALYLPGPAEARRSKKTDAEATGDKAQKGDKAADTADKAEDKGPDKSADKSAEKSDTPADSNVNGPLTAAAAKAVTDFPAATRRLEEAFRKAPSSETLYQLGLLFDAQGKLAEAQDYMRRYLADPTTDAGAPGRVEAERVMALPRPQCGEVQVLADQYGFVSVDGRLVGTLPFSVPLIVPVGPHVVTVEMRDRAMKGKVKVPDGRGVELSFNRASGAVIVTLPPAVIVLPQYSGAQLPAEMQRRIQQAVEQAIQKQRLAVFSKDVALGRSPKLADCLNKLACQAQLATENEVDYALTMRVEHSGQAPSSESYSLNLSLIDAETADVAATAKPSCTACNAEQIATSLLEPVRAMIKEGQGRQRGTLIVSSEPPGAEVKLGSRVVGKTPYSRAAFVGSYELVLEKKEFQISRTDIEIKEGKPAKYELKLVADVKAQLVIAPPPKAVEKARRPLWRLLAGGVTLGLGVSMMGFGIGALAVNGGCVSDPIPPAAVCSDRFATKTVGGALVGVGVVLAVGGAVAMALPPGLFKNMFKKESAGADGQ
jgi:hypothetical protein